ncbi:uncharacterized protein LOC144750750 [Ciona intestinalis]
MWEITEELCDISLASLIDRDISSSRKQRLFVERIATYYQEYTQVYCDGSKQESGCGCSFVIPSEGYTSSSSLHKSYSAYSCELFAILMALKHVNSKEPHMSYVIMSDCLNAITSIAQRRHSKNFILNQILELIFNILNGQMNIKILWVPSHCGIPGNEESDEYAKQSARTNHCDVATMALTDCIPILHANLRTKFCEYYLQNNQNTAMKNIFPTLPSNNDFNQMDCRIEEVIYYRLLTGHNRLNAHLNRIGLHENGQCPRCNVDETAEHLLTSCINSANVTEMLKTVCSEMKLP